MAYTKAYADSRAYSDECWDGDGQCDGFVYGGLYVGEECGCGCHTGPTLHTYEEVVEYHKDQKQYK